MIDYEKLKLAINDVQAATIERLIKALHGCHHIDIIVRSGGKDLHFEADWLELIFQELTQPKCHPIKDGVQNATLKKCETCGASYWDEKSKPEYDIDDMVWFHYNDEIKNDFIRAIDMDAYGQFQYSVGMFELKQQHLYASREALIQAQIEYWTSLATEESFDQSVQYEHVNDAARYMNPKFKQLIPGLYRCIHESDGKMYGAMEWGALGVLKCKKCEEFYE